MNEILIRFYTADGEDHAGRTHSDILAFDDRDLETTHDFIQWLFPTSTPSSYNPEAPLLDEETIAVLKDDQAFRTRFFQAAGRMLRFWDIAYAVDEKENILVMPISHKTSWMVYDNHNLLRMTRLMESARLLGFKTLAETLFEALLGIVGNRFLRTDDSEGAFHFITSENVYHWYRAAFGRNI
jgi:hypothetical protein